MTDAEENLGFVAVDSQFAKAELLFKSGVLNGRAEGFSAVGKSTGIVCVTWPEAAHFVPRKNKP